MWFTAGSEASSTSKVFLEGERLIILENKDLAKNSNIAASWYRGNPVSQLMGASSLTSWSLSGIPTGATWEAAGFGNGRFVAIGSIYADGDEEPVYGSVVNISIYSDDGINWKVGPTLGSRRFWNFYSSGVQTSNSIMYGNQRFVALSSSEILSSADGITWQSSPAPHPSGQVPVHRAFGNGLFIYKTGSSNHTYYTSTDGISWTTRTFPSFAGVLLDSQGGYNDITFNGGVFMTTTSFKSASWDISTLKSTDGINWTRVPSPAIPAGETSLSFLSITINDSGTHAFFNGQYNGGYRLTIATNTWQLSNNQHYSTRNSGFFKGNFFCISDSDISISSDGLTWTRTLNALPIAATQAILISGGSYYKNPLIVDYLVVAGGGGGGGAALPSGNSPIAAGGGGAGGYRSSVPGQLSGAGSNAETRLHRLSFNTPYPVSVGVGGAGGVRSVNGNGGSSGTNSVFSTIVSIGGGGGGAGGLSGTPAKSGGSGGGSSGSGSPSHVFAGGQGTVGQGLFGSGQAGTGGGCGGRGGGGSQGTFSDSSTITGTPGGSGTTSSITGSQIQRAGGGGGGGGGCGDLSVGGNGGNGGGGRGGGRSGGVTPIFFDALPGTSNTGGGGGGGGAINGSQGDGQAGGSGVVILRYPSPYNITIGAGLVGSTDTTSVPGFKITTLTQGSGNVSWALA